MAINTLAILINCVKTSALILGFSSLRISLTTQKLVCNEDEERVRSEGRGVEEEEVRRGREGEGGREREGGVEGGREREGRRGREGEGGKERDENELGTVRRWIKCWGTTCSRG